MSGDERDPRADLHAKMRSLHRHRQELARLEALRADELDRIELWWADVSHGETQRIAQLEAEITEWARAHRDPRTKSFKTPWGTVSTRENTIGRVVVDDEAALIEWAEENGYLKPPAAPKVDIDAIRRQFEQAEVAGRDVLVVRTDAETGAPEVLVPGLHIEGIGDVSVRIGGE